MARGSSAIWTGVEALIVLGVLYFAISRGYVQKGIDALNNLSSPNTANAQGQTQTCPDGSVIDASATCPAAANNTPAAANQPAAAGAPGAPGAAGSPGAAGPAGPAGAAAPAPKPGSPKDVVTALRDAAKALFPPGPPSRVAKPAALRASNPCSQKTPCGSTCGTVQNNKIVNLFACCTGTNLTRSFVASRTACCARDPFHNKKSCP